PTPAWSCSTRAWSTPPSGGRSPAPSPPTSPSRTWSPSAASPDRPLPAGGPHGPRSRYTGPAPRTAVPGRAGPRFGIPIRPVPGRGAGPVRRECSCDRPLPRPDASGEEPPGEHRAPQEGERRRRSPGAPPGSPAAGSGPARGGGRPGRTPRTAPGSRNDVARGRSGRTAAERRARLSVPPGGPRRRAGAGARSPPGRRRPRAALVAALLHQALGDHGAGGHPELGQDVLHVGVHGALGDDQPLGDLPVGQPAGDEHRHLALAGGEPGGGGALRGRVRVEEVGVVGGGLHDALQRVRGALGEQLVE